MRRIMTGQNAAAAAVLFLAVSPSLMQASDRAPSAEDIVNRMAERDAERHASFSGYTVSRRYEVVNNDRHAEMLVRVLCSTDGGTQFSIMNEE